MIRLALLITILATPALGNVPCGPRDNVIAPLTGPRYEEALQLERTEGEQLHELYANEETGTWSYVATQNGITCLLLYGVDFNLPEDGDPA